MAYHKVHTSRDTEFSEHEILIGNLPPADHLLTAFSVTFPMITKPSNIQLASPYPTDTALAINFVVCKPINLTTIMNLQYHDPLHYVDAYQTVTPIATNSTNDSIDFLPHGEYILFRVVQLIDPKDPTSILPKNYPLHMLLSSKALLSVAQPTLMALPLNLPSLHQELESSLLPLIITNIPSSPMLMEIPTPRSQSRPFSTSKLPNLSKPTIWNFGAMIHCERTTLPMIPQRSLLPWQSV
jgi:hypothetical protein